MRDGLARTPIASVGPVVSDELKSHGLRTDISPANDAYFMKPLISAMAAALAKERRRAEPRARLIHLGARELDHLAPILGFVRNELSESAAETGSRKDAELGKLRLGLGIGEDLIDSLLSLSMISGGVLFGAARPYQALAS